ncbi:MAG: UDP-N-acetylmuramoyl-L-alanyl-D-glutamate--2,6-diaminopimelate ligase [Acidimicrobiia bacterium]
MRFHDLLEGLDPEWRGDASVDVQGLTHDSRRVVPGMLFCCVPGATTDGHEHAAAAVAAGAVALLVERFVAPDVPQARVADVRAALGPVAARGYGEPSRALRCLGVTGTNGKTTTTYLLEHVVQAAGERAGVIGTIGARVDGTRVPGVHTTPEAPELQLLLARMRDAGVGTVAMEVSSHALAQRRVDGTFFAATCFTNLTHEHLDYHRDLATYFEAKAHLFTPELTAAAVVNVDDPFGPELLERARSSGLPATAYGLSDRARFTAVSVEHEADRTRFVLVDRGSGERAPVTTTLVGGFNVVNALAAAATATAAGIGFEHVVAGLCRPLVVPGRLERIDAGQQFLVFVDYAHTPDALTRVLDVARSLTSAGRVLVVFGCGGDRDAEKRPMMGAAAAAGADLAFVTSDNPRSEEPQAIADEIVDGWRGGTPFIVDLDRRAAIGRAVREARRGDVLVIAGKGHEAGQTTAGRTVPFDDRVVVREELEALGELRCT